MTSPSKIKTTEIVYKDVKQVFSIFLSNRTFRIGYENIQSYLVTLVHQNIK
jgi:hypothetical protein